MIVVLITKSKKNKFVIRRNQKQDAVTIKIDVNKTREYTAQGWIQTSGMQFSIKVKSLDA